VEQEVNIVQAVFPNPSHVMQVFLQRVFAQSVRFFLQTVFVALIDVQIQQYLEIILNKATQLSTLSFLRMLNLMHVQTSKLVNDLKGQELTAISMRPTSLYDGYVASGGTVHSMASMLESAMDELFVPYTEGQRYLEVEVRSLGELYSSYLSMFTKFHVSSYAHIHAKPDSNSRADYLSEVFKGGDQPQGLWVKPVRRTHQASDHQSGRSVGEYQLQNGCFRCRRLLEGRGTTPVSR
jgi:hypothetical protein